LLEISGVNYRNGIYTVDLAKSLLDNGNAKTQDEWTAYAINAMSQNEFYTPDYPLFYGLLKAMYDSRNDSAKANDLNDARNL